MKGLGWIAPSLAAAGVAALAATFASELGSFKGAVVAWARRDLAARAQLAAANLREPLATSDFDSIHAFGRECVADGLRLTVVSPAGGVFFDTLAPGEVEEASIYESAPCGGRSVRLGMPLARVHAPYEKAKSGFLLAALFGAAGVLSVFFLVYRQGVRIRELARLEKFRREFVADVSHEIKTPLAGIIGAVDLLSDCPESQRGRLLGMARSEAVRLNALAQGILDLAKLERRGAVVEKVPADAGALASEAVARFAEKAKAAGVELALAAGSDAAGTVQCDPALVSEVLANLVENALRHSGSPTVEVSAVRTRRHVVFAVEDHGRGVPEESAERVFERFYRVDPSRAEATGGAGLGLAIVRRVARMHGGDARLRRAKPHGCRFEVSLPA